MNSSAAHLNGCISTLVAATQCVTRHNRVRHNRAIGSPLPLPPASSAAPSGVALTSRPQSHQKTSKLTPAARDEVLGASGLTLEAVQLGDVRRHARPRRPAAVAQSTHTHAHPPTHTHTHTHPNTFTHPHTNTHTHTQVDQRTARPRDAGREVPSRYLFGHDDTDHCGLR